MNSPSAIATPAVLRWARETAGYSVEEVAAKLGRKRVNGQSIREWEAGTARPSYAQLRDLADHYRRSLALFYLPKPPQEEMLEEKFSSLPGKYVRALPPAMRLMVRQARVMQLNVAELNDGMPAGKPASLMKCQVGSAEKPDIKNLARRVRKCLGITLEKQKGWQSDDIALRDWRACLVSCGIWVFTAPFGNDDYEGFYLPDEHFPVIYLNHSRDRAGQIFTLFHELGHFLLAKGGMSFRGDMEKQLTGNFRQEEVFCNGFAGEFLVADDDFQAEIKEGGISDEQIREYANRYRRRSFN